MKIFGFAGYSGSGKTTLIEKLIPLLTARGLSVSVRSDTGGGAIGGRGGLNLPYLHEIPIIEIWATPAIEFCCF